VLLYEGLAFCGRVLYKFLVRFRAWCRHGVAGQASRECEKSLRLRTGHMPRSPIRIISYHNLLVIASAVRCGIEGAVEEEVCTERSSKDCIHGRFAIRRQLGVRERGAVQMVRLRSRESWGVVGDGQG